MSTSDERLISRIQEILIAYDNPNNGGAGHHNIVYSQREIMKLIQAHSLQERIDELAGVRGWNTYDPDHHYCDERFHVVPYSYLADRIKSLTEELEKL